MSTDRPTNQTQPMQGSSREQKRNCDAGTRVLNTEPCRARLQKRERHGSVAHGRHHHHRHHHHRHHVAWYHVWHTMVTVCRGCPGIYRDLGGTFDCHTALTHVYNLNLPTKHVVVWQSYSGGAEISIRKGNHISYLGATIPVHCC